MYNKIRSLIFKLDPETAHNLAIQTLKLNKFNKRKKEYNKKLSSEIFGKQVDNPIGLAAGFDKNAEVYNSIFNLGFGFVEVGTITPLKQYGNPKPRVFRLEEDEALINRLGFNNSGAENISQRIKQNPPKGFFGINIGPNKESKDKINDYLICLKKFYNLADYITINISSPNTENLRELHDHEKLDNLLESINNEKKKLSTNVPIVVKISPDIDESEIDRTSELFINKNISAVIISNTTDKFRDNLKNANRLEKGGLSGKPLSIKSDLLIQKFYKNLKGKVKIIGVGGIDSAIDVISKLRSGANLVQLYTGMVFKGPSIASKINTELDIMIEKEGFKNLNEIVGTK